MACESMLHVSTKMRHTQWEDIQFKQRCGEAQTPYSSGQYHI